MSTGKDKLLFTPGPLTTSPAVKAALNRDVGSRDAEFIGLIATIRDRLLALAGVSKAAGYEAVPMQGSGTFAIEAALTSCLGEDDRLLVATNGTYGDRIGQIARLAGKRVDVVKIAGDRRIEASDLEQRLRGNCPSTHVAVVHCETSSGIVNDVPAIAALARATGRKSIVDSRSAFGAIDVDMRSNDIQFLISSANKCIQGVPGFAFVLCEREALETCEGRSRSLSLDLHAQWRGLESSGQFRFTPPTQAMLAFATALDELDSEGGPPARLSRYANNQQRLVRGMRELGFATVLPDSLHGPVITTFLYPEDPGFVFDTFYEKLAERGCVIYPGKLSDIDCFRIGTAGHLFEQDIEILLTEIANVAEEMGLAVR